MNSIDHLDESVIRCIASATKEDHDFSWGRNLHNIQYFKFKEPVTILPAESVIIKDGCTHYLGCVSDNGNVYAINNISHINLANCIVTKTPITLTPVDLYPYFKWKVI